MNPRHFSRYLIGTDACYFGHALTPANAVAEDGSYETWCRACLEDAGIGTPE